MAGVKAIFACCFLALGAIKCSMAAEAACSKFSYEQEIIASVIKIQLNVEQMEKEIKKTQIDILKELGDQREKMEKFAKDYRIMRDILVVVMENKTAEVAKVLEDKTAEIENILDNKTAEVNKVLEDAVDKGAAKPVVSFSAAATKQQTSPVDGQIVIFDSVITNIGNAYDCTSGKFIAPVSGTYIFFCSILSGNNDEFWMVMAVNSSAKAFLYERGTDGRHGMASQTIIVHLNPGDVVTVNTRSGAGNVYGSKYSTFNGFLLP